MKRSISAAIMQEILARGRLPLIGTLLGFNIFSAWLFGAIRFNGNVSPLEPSLILIHIIFLQVGLFVLGFSLGSTNFTLARLYAYPISNRHLVISHWIPAMVIAAAFAMVSAIFLNATLDLNWPVLTSILFATTVAAACQAAIWQTNNQFWRMALMSIAGILFLWHRSRYGSLFEQPTRMWTHVTVVELLSMLSIVVISYFLAVRGVARCRRGDDLPDFGILALIRRWFHSARFNSTSNEAFRFRGPAQAQFWYEWKVKGWLMPAVVGAFLVVTFAACILYQEDPEKLLTGIIRGSVALVLAGFVMGIFFGTCGLSDDSKGLGQFVSARPISSGSISHMILKAAAVSLGLVWSIWALAFVTIYSFLIARGSVPTIETPADLGWRYFPIVILGSWLAMVTVASLMLTGRTKIIVTCVTVVYSSFLGLLILESAHLLPRLTQRESNALLVLFGLALLIGTLWTFIAAYRKSLISSRSILLASVLWLALSSFVGIEWAFFPARPFAIYVMLLGCLAWVVAPIAVGPLAVSLNRVR